MVAVLTLVELHHTFKSPEGRVFAEFIKLIGPENGNWIEAGISGSPSPLNVANVISKVIFVESATLISSHPGFNSPLVTINYEPLNSPS